MEDVANFYAQIPGSKLLDYTSSMQSPYYYTIPCWTWRLPHVSFTIGGKELRISRSSLVGGKNEDGSGCYGNIVGDYQPEGQTWILGEKWMSNFYTIFDSENSRVGFADLK
jgi:Eukaryotic aspartyl protease